MRFPFWPLLLGAVLVAGCVNYEKAQLALARYGLNLSEWVAF